MHIEPAKPRASLRLDAVLCDPASVFESPDAVAADSRLTREEKIEALRSWEYDAAAMAVAEEEGMPGPDSDDLHRIRVVLSALTPGPDAEFVTPTKQHAFLR